MCLHLYVTKCKCLHYLRWVLPMRSVIVYWTLCWVSLVRSLQCSHVSSSWLWIVWWNLGEGGGCPLGLNHNVHIPYLEVKDDAPQQLVMFVHLVGLWFLHLQMVCLACRYFKLHVNWVFTHQASFLIYLSHYIASIILVCLLYLPVLCWKCVNKLRLQYEGTPKYLGDIAHRHRIQAKEKTERFRCIYNIWGF